MPPAFLTLSVSGLPNLQADHNCLNLILSVLAFFVFLFA
jgi:hypothetical protein